LKIKDTTLFDKEKNALKEMKEITRPLSMCSPVTCKPDYYVLCALYVVSLLQ